MKSTSNHTMILLVIFTTCSLVAFSASSPAGINDFLNALSPSATGKPGTDEYTIRDLMDDRYKGNIGFLHEICPPLARVANQLCQAVQNIIQRCIGFVTGGGFGGSGRGDTNGTTEATNGGSTSEGSAEETTPSSGSDLDESNPKFGGSDASTSSDSSSESSSTESSSENSTDKSSDKEGETTTEK